LTVINGGDGELIASVDEAGRELVVDALRDYGRATTEAMLPAGPVDRAALRARLETIAAIREQLDGTSGTVQLAGPEAVIAEVIRSAASAATNDLDRLVEALTGSATPFEEEAIDALRARQRAAMVSIEALIALESCRRNV
jgi:hypothetical protein